MRRSTILIFTASLVACSGKPAPPPPPIVVATPVPTPAPPAVGSVTLGNAIGSDKVVTAASETFGVKDVIYASVATSGVGHIKLRAVWTFVKGDKTTQVHEDTIEFDSTVSATNEFHIENSKGWPKGDYRLDVYLGDSAAPVTTRNFKVQ
jgi:hypothetical protein